MKSLSILPLLFSFALATSRTTPPSSSCLTVGKSGFQFTSVQSAVNALSTTSTTAQCIFINPGTYSEQVLIPARAAQLSVYGFTQDISSYKSNQVTITANFAASQGLSDDETGTLRIKSNNFRLYNINVNNGFGSGSQAIALSAYAASGYYGCAFTGFQDTVLSEQDNQVYVNCLIQGATDFVFGQTATSWFEGCDIRVLAASQGFITANGRDSASNPSNYVFNNCNVAAASGNSVAAGAYYLGRPWEDFARVTFQKCSLSNVINSAGWSVWEASDPNTDHVSFTEFQNTGAGAAGPRASFSSQLSAAVTMATVLGSNFASQGFYDASYF